MHICSACKYYCICNDKEMPIYIKAALWTVCCTSALLRTIGLIPNDLTSLQRIKQTAQQQQHHNNSSIIKYLSRSLQASSCRAFRFMPHLKLPRQQHCVEPEQDIWARWVSTHHGVQSKVRQTQYGNVWSFEGKTLNPVVDHDCPHSSCRLEGVLVYPFLDKAEFNITSAVF